MKSKKNYLTKSPKAVRQQVLQKRGFGACLQLAKQKDDEQWHGADDFGPFDNKSYGFSSQVLKRGYLSALRSHVVEMAKSIQSTPFVPDCNTFAEQDLNIKKAVSSDFMGFGFEAWLQLDCGRLIVIVPVIGAARPLICHSYDGGPAFLIAISSSYFLWNLCFVVFSVEPLFSWKFTILGYWVCKYVVNKYIYQYLYHQRLISNGDYWEKTNLYIYRNKRISYQKQ
eukprot:g39328.t1